jgi:hypothetical protein
MKSRKRRIHFPWSTPEWALPNEDAEGYIGDVIQCAEQLLFGEDVESFEDREVKEVSEEEDAEKDEEHWEERWEEEASTLEIRIEALGLTQAEADQAWAHFEREFENTRKREEEQQAKDESYDASDGYDEYEGIYSEDSDFLVDPSEYVFEKRDLIAQANAAVAAGDADELVRLVELFEQLTGIESDEDVILNWGLLLVDWKEPTRRQADKLDERAVPCRQDIIKLMDDTSDRLCRIIARDPNSLDDLEWRVVEQVIARALTGLGFEVVLTEGSKDGGKDVVAKCEELVAECGILLRSNTGEVASLWVMRKFSTLLKSTRWSKLTGACFFLLQAFLKAYIRI